jgi:glutaredoxin
MDSAIVTSMLSYGRFGLGEKMEDISIIIVYGTTWCGDCYRTRRFLDKQSVPYRWINIDEDIDAEQIVLKLNRGMRSVPTILFPDGTMLVEPSNTALSQKLG